MEKVTLESQNIVFFGGDFLEVFCVLHFSATEDLWKIGFIVFFGFSSFCGLNKIDICEMISACFKEQMLVSIYVVS